MNDTPSISTHDAEDDPRNRDIRIYVNGRLVPRDEARVSVYDSGFMLGDGVWEGLRLYNGVFAFLDEHLDRLYEAALALDLDVGMSREALARALHETAEGNGMRDGVHMRLMVTRGPKRSPDASIVRTCRRPWFRRNQSRTSQLLRAWKHPHAKEHVTWPPPRNRMRSLS